MLPLCFRDRNVLRKQTFPLRSRSVAWSGCFIDHQESHLINRERRNPACDAARPRSRAFSRLFAWGDSVGQTAAADDVAAIVAVAGLTSGGKVW
jgi:hypothetical protein